MNVSCQIRDYNQHFADVLTCQFVVVVYSVSAVLFEGILYMQKKLNQSVCGCNSSALQNDCFCYNKQV